MKIATIASRQTLELITDSPYGYHFFLGQYVMTEKALQEKIKALYHEGRFIIVDNGAAERDPADFAGLVSILGNEVDEVILPDVIGEPAHSMGMTIQYAHEVPVHKRFVVPQGRDATEYMYYLTQLNRELDFVTIGVPKHLDVNNGPDERFKVLEEIKRRGIHLRYNIHMLGMAANYPLEYIQKLKKNFSWVRGIDTGAPVAWAQNGLDIGEGMVHRPSLDYEEYVAGNGFVQLVLENVTRMNYAGLTGEIGAYKLRRS